MTARVELEKHAATLLPSLFQQTSNIPPAPLCVLTNTPSLSLQRIENKSETATGSAPVTSQSLIMVKESVYCSGLHCVLHCVLHCALHFALQCIDRIFQI